MLDLPVRWQLALYKFIPELNRGLKPKTSVYLGFHPHQFNNFYFT